ncbi:MAG: LuxR family transcriptional regulator [Alphaproteobacteria bacterium]|nr:LuxR family transcriptional regulator [Alphaproteobacteria bacterium]MBL6939811.1 LuxR family transcriptional regulator [Alphaproteobacteria bacterium]MBL7098264.1 LuxR family transcriptional regulator [Alphaproteobacteria bacterium]
MSRFSEVAQFVSAANRITDLDELRTLLDGFVRSLGFDYYALVHHAGMVHAHEKRVHLHDFPEDWESIIRERNYFCDDPVHVACQTSFVPFTWEDVPNMIALSPKQREMLAAAREAGLGNGFTVPIHIPGERIASCTFSIKNGRKIPNELLPMAQYMGCFAFEAARRVVESTPAKKPHLRRAPSPPRLTRRQLDCVVLAGQGKSDRDIAQILDIGYETAHQHMEDAKRKYGVATRMQLIVRTLFDNHIAFADLMPN